MKRYQLYLNPHSVSIIDEIGEFTDISRSSVIRMAVDSVAINISKLLVNKAPNSKKYTHLDSLMGSIDIKGKDKVNFSGKEDEIYYKD